MSVVVGLTGGIGSGKSEASRIFLMLGVPVVDVDAISHQLTEPGQMVLKRIIQVFGDDFLSDDGRLDRKKMRDTVFQSPDALAQLEAILHPAIFEKVQQELSAPTHVPYQLLAVPLLFEGGSYISMIHCSVLIDCDEETQIRRVMQRSQLSREEVLRIMRKQLSREERRSRADYVIENNGDLALLEQNIRSFHEKMLLDLHG